MLVNECPYSMTYKLNVKPGFNSVLFMSLDSGPVHARHAYGPSPHSRNLTVFV